LEVGGVDGTNVRLMPHRLSVGQPDGPGVLESAHAAQGAEVVVERPVLLHEEADVLDVVDRAGLVVGRNRQDLLEVDGNRGGGRDAQQL
jgi:hypothetical protein